MARNTNGKFSLKRPLIAQEREHRNRRCIDIVIYAHITNKSLNTNNNDGIRHVVLKKNKLLLFYLRCSFFMLLFFFVKRPMINEFIKRFKHVFITLYR